MAMEDQYEELNNSPLLNEQGGMDMSSDIAPGQPQHFPAPQTEGAPQGASAPDWRSALGVKSQNPEGTVPDWRNAVKPQEGSVWDTIKATAGARIDALAAGMLQDEGSDRSRYAMKRAERTNQEAAVQESQLSGLQKVGVGAADIGVGLAASAVNPALGMGYFTAQGTADQLRQQAAETGRYDLEKAADVGIAQGVAGEVVPGLVNPLVARAAGKLGSVASRVATSGVGQAATGGAGAGASMQMVSNLANGKPLTEGVGEAALTGAVGGVGAHAAAPVARAAVRLPKTLGEIQGAGAAEAARRPNPLADQARAQSEQFRAQQETAPEAAPAVPAEEGVLGGGEAPNEAGAIPGANSFDPNMYGPEVRNSQWSPGMGFGPGAPEQRTPGTIPEEIRGTPKEYAHTAEHLWDTFKAEGAAGLLSPKGVKQMTDAELTFEKQGIKPDSSLVKQAQATEASTDILQQKLESEEIGSPEYQETVKAMTNLSLKSGSAAAHARANALALDVDMPVTSQFHNITLTEGVANPNTPRNIAKDVHGISPAQLEAEHRAVLESKGTSIPGMSEVRENQRERFQTYESHHNATRDSYLKAQNKVDNSFEHNLDLAKNVRSQLRDSEQPDMFRRAQELTDDLNSYNSMKTDISNGKPLDTDKLSVLAGRITDNATALGVAPKMKNVLGEAGTFNPTLDLQAWHNFNVRTRQMHPSAPKGQFKDMVAAKEIGIEGLDLNRPGSWLKVGQKVTKAATNASKATQSMARGAVMAKAGANRPVRAEEAPEMKPEDMVASEDHINESLRQNDTDAASTASQAALNESGISTGNTTLADTVAQEVHPAAMQATVGQRAYLKSINHPRAGAEDLTAGEADLHMTHAMAQQAGGTPEGNAERAAAMAQRPQEAAPVEAPAPVEPEAPVEAPAEPVQPFEGVRKPNALPEAEVAPEPAQARTVEPIKAPKKLAPKEEVKPEAEEAQKEPTQEEPKKTEEEVVAEAKVDQPVAEEHLDFKEGESSEHRNKRVADMARKIVIKETEKTIKAPMKNSSIEAKKRAEGMRKGINDALEHAEDVADKQGVETADVITAMMSQKGGIESIFKDGYGKDAIKGRINKAVTAFKTEKRLMAQQHIKEAENIVRKRLGEANSRSREEMDDRARANMKALGMSNEVIEKAFANAKGVTHNYTVQQVVQHARQIVRSSKVSKPVGSAQQKPGIHTTRKLLEGWVKENVKKAPPGVKESMLTHVFNETKGNGDAFTPEQTEAFIKGMSSKLKERILGATKAVENAAEGPRKEQAQKRLQALKETDEALKGSTKELHEKAKAAEAEANKAKAETEAQTKRANEEEAKNRELIGKLDQMQKDMEAQQADAVAKAKAELRTEAMDMDNGSIKEFGSVISEHLPDSVAGVNDPDYLTWKAQIDVAGEELRKRGLKTDSNFMAKLGEIVEKGLKRREELPDHPDLVITQTDYNQLRDLYNKVRKGGEMNIPEAGNVQMGTVGIKLRTLLLGDKMSERKIRYNTNELTRLRDKALSEKSSVGEHGLDVPGIK